MAKLEDVLKKQGFTDADLAAAQTLLGDQRFRGAVEGYTSGLEQDLGAFRKENNDWADWAEKTNKPQLDGYVRESLDLKGKVGSLEARLKAVDPTFTGGGEGKAPERAAAAGGGVPATGDFDPKQFGLVTEKDVERYAAQQGTAIVIAQDLQQEYRRLTGKDMLDYETTADGRTLRGMTALLHEARTAKTPMPDYIAQKFDFAGKRAQMKVDADKAHDEAIRKDERAKAIAEMSNPNARPGLISTNPFVPRAVGDGTPKQPWEVSAAERRNSRIVKNTETQARSMAGLN